MLLGKSQYLLDTVDRRAWHRCLSWQGRVRGLSGRNVVIGVQMLSGMDVEEHPGQMA